MQKTYTCKYCGKIWVTNGQSYGAHISNCKMNPKYQQIHLKISKANKGKCSRQLPEKHQYKLICSKCKKEYSVFVTQYIFNIEKYNKYCSRSCANSRTHSNQTKDKISKGVKLAKMQKVYYCELCNSKIIGNNLSPRHYCDNCIDVINTPIPRLKICQICNKEFSTTNKVRTQCISCINKQAYASGRNYVAGGTTKWINVDTSNGIIKVQGSYQYRMCKILDKMKQNGDIKDWQYTNDRIPYIGVDDKQHSYLLDFKLYNIDQSVRYVQTKGRIQQNDYLKWKSARQQGLNLQICFESDLKEYETIYNI